MVFSDKKEDRSVSVLLDELVASNQPWRVYTVRYVIDVPALRKRHEEMKARKKAEEAEKEEKKKREDGA